MFKILDDNYISTKNLANLCGRSRCFIDTKIKNGEILAVRKAAKQVTYILNKRKTIKRWVWAVSKFDATIAQKKFSKNPEERNIA